MKKLSNLEKAVRNQALSGNPLTPEEIEFQKNLSREGIIGDEAADAIINDALKDAKPDDFE